MPRTLFNLFNQGLVKWAKLCLNPYFFGWLEKYSLHVENKSKDFWNKVSLLLQDLGLIVNAKKSWQRLEVSTLMFNSVHISDLKFVFNVVRWNLYLPGLLWEEHLLLLLFEHKWNVCPFLICCQSIEPWSSIVKCIVVTLVNSMWSRPNTRLETAPWQSRVKFFKMINYQPNKQWLSTTFPSCVQWRSHYFFQYIGIGSRSVGF